MASLLLLLVVAVSAAAALPSPLDSSHISRLLEIQDRERHPAAVQLAAARGVLRRLLPSHLSSFEFHIIPKKDCGGKACFIINNHPSSGGNGAPEIIISGVTGVELSAGLHWYLKYWCGAHISWEKSGGAQLSSVPKSGSLPHVDSAGILIKRPVPWNYYQNAVTSSYTFSWWDWERWEKEIDWMALQGINLPLAFNGQEAIWEKVFKKFNISSSDLDDFFGGPAFLAWSRMGNLHRWGGPLPRSWLDDQLVLQKKIISRMFELGMSPVWNGFLLLDRRGNNGILELKNKRIIQVNNVAKNNGRLTREVPAFDPYLTAELFLSVLPAFSGNVPSALKSNYPSAKITRLGNWFTVNSDSRWCCTYLLDATDPLFIEIGRAFITQQLKEYGKSSHIYNCDTFDENTPPIEDPQYISLLGAAIYSGMQSGDVDAIWLMQGWLFSYDPFWRPPQMKALLHSVPIGRLVVLDLFAEVKPIWVTSEQFYGVPYIWCMLHNFAGNIEMYGVLDSVASGPIEARISQNSTMVGVGMCMEGIEQNPVVYDLMSEMAFHHKKVDMKMWIDLYPTRRYGKHVAAVQEAWKILYHTVYNCTDGAYDKNRDVIVAIPDVDPSTILVLEIFGAARYLHSGRKLSNVNLFKEPSGSFDQPHLWYSTADVIHALELFLAHGDELSSSYAFRYDLIDLTRQALAKHANQIFLRIIEAYELVDLNNVAIYSQHFLDLVRDLDTLLSCHDGFLLGPWLESAKRLAKDPDQEKQYEWNARTQITMWFDNSETEASLLRDYGNKYWSGLLKDYYGPRAAIYFKYLSDSMMKAEAFPLEDWRREWISFTNQWQNSRKVFPVKGSGDALNISRWLYEKYLAVPYLKIS